METLPAASFSPILAPMTALVLWTLVVWVWMYATRLPAMRRARIDSWNLVGGSGPDLRAKIDARSQWPADNYNHLLEQPTLFYAVCAILALAGAGYAFNLDLAWAYVGLRVAHSLVQMLWNRVIARFALFTLATAVLAALAFNAAAVVLDL